VVNSFFSGPDRWDDSATVAQTGEDWKTGRMEGWKDGRLEGWNIEQGAIKKGFVLEKRMETNRRIHGD
jgi:hypothetical protein